MKAIILAAGESTRLKKYTKHLPKGMLNFAGKSLIEHQINLFNQVGIVNIVVVKGFAGEKINFSNVIYYTNIEFSTTNMVASLFCAQKELEGDVVVSYADILFEAGLLKKLIEAQHDIAVCVDMNWHKYWYKRYGSIHVDTESLKIDRDLIIGLGKKNPPASEIDGRYVGLLKFSAEGVSQLKEVWHKFKDDFWDIPWQISGKPLKKAYMTDILQAVIDEGYEVHVLETKNGWIEFDTNEDYEKALEWRKNGTLDCIVKLEKWSEIDKL